MDKSTTQGEGDPDSEWAQVRYFINTQSMIMSNASWNIKIKPKQKTLVLQV